MKKAVVLFLCAILVAVCYVPVGAHSGKTDAAGGHYDNSTGEYHYHHGYSAHQHPNGVCPYGGEDKTQHQSSSSSSSSSSGSSSCEFPATAFIIIFIILIVFCVYKFFSSGSSSSSSQNVGKQSSSKSSTTTSVPSNVSNPEISSLQDEIKSLNRKIKSLQETIRIHELTIKEKDSKISELQSTDAQREILELNRDLMWLRGERDTLESKLRSSIKSHEKYVREKEAELKKLKDAATPISQLDYDKEKQKVSSLEKANQDQKKTIDSLRLELSSLKESIASDNRSRIQDKKKYEAEISRLRLVIADQSVKTEDTSEKDKKIAELQAFQDIFYPKMEELSQKYSSIFAGYPTLDAFYQQVIDKRFHRSLVENISFGNKIDIECQIVSSGKVYTTSLTKCSCTDFATRKVVCKHMLFLSYNIGVILLNRQRMEKNLKIYLDELRSTPPKK